jgi:hypothetical protein
VSWITPRAGPIAASCPSAGVLGLALALGLAAIISGCAEGAYSRLPAEAVPASYHSLFVGLAPVGLSLPPLVASTSLVTVEARFPRQARAGASPASGGAGQLYVGFALARLSCMDEFLAGVSFGPGALLTVRLARHHLPRGEACFELIGPLMYQVVELPLARFPIPIHLEVVVRHPQPAGAPPREYLELD